MITKHRYHVGDWVIYRKSKQSPNPGPRAQQVSPSRHGEDYSYVVDKYWVVTEVLPDDHLRLRTRRGKQHEISADDPALRPVRFWERWLYHQRFQNVVHSMNGPEGEPA